MRERYSSEQSQNRLSDHDIVLDLLNSVKQISHMCDSAILDASHMELRTTIEELQSDEHETARVLNDFMQNQGAAGFGAARQPASRRYQSQARGDALQQARAESLYASTTGVSRNFGSQLADRNRQQNRRDYSGSRTLL